MISKNELHALLHNSLTELELTEHEINLYALSLSNGPTPISTLATQLGITRPNIYKVIIGLETRGLANFSKHKRHARTFMVEPPTVVTALLRKKRTAIEQKDQELIRYMPDLLALYQQGELPTSVRVFHGKDQFIKLMFDVLEETQDSFCFFGDFDHLLQFISTDREAQWIKRRMEKKIFMKALVLPNPEAKQLQKGDNEQLRETRILQSPIEFKSSFDIFGKKTVFWQPQFPLALLIEDEYITAMLQSIFEMLWKQSKTTT